VSPHARVEEGASGAGERAALVLGDPPVRAQRDAAGQIPRPPPPAVLHRAADEQIRVPAIVVGLGQDGVVDLGRTVGGRLVDDVDVDDPLAELVGSRFSMRQACEAYQLSDSQPTKIAGRRIASRTSSSHGTETGMSSWSNQQLIPASSSRATICLTRSSSARA
jgi:hypothetical protein